MEGEIPLKILYIGTLPPHPGGSAIVGYQLLCGFAHSGHRVQALAPVTPETEISSNNFESSHPEIRLQRFNVPHFEMPPYFPYPDSYIHLEQEAVKSRLARMMATNRPDIILIGRETYARYVPDLAHLHGIPCALIIHGGLTHGVVDGTHSAEFANYLLSQYRKVDLLITPSKHMAADLKRFGIITRVIPNPVDMDVFSPSNGISAFRSKCAAQDEILIANVGHLRDLKRSLDLVFIAEESLKRNPKLVFLVVGDGPLRIPMEKLCAEKGLSEKFHFTGWVEHNEVGNYIRAADIMIMPTAIENQALVYLETQACSRTLLASDIPAAREVIVHTKTGFLFQMGNVEDCCAKLLPLAEDHRLRDAIGRNARDAVRIHSLDRSVRLYINAMKRLLRGVPVVK